MVDEPKQSGYRQRGCFSRVLEAAIDLADADSEDEAAFERARWRLEKAVKTWAERGVVPVRKRGRDEATLTLFVVGKGS